MIRNSLPALFLAGALLVGSGCTYMPAMSTIDSSTIDPSSVPLGTEVTLPAPQVGTPADVVQVDKTNTAVEVQTGSMGSMATADATQVVQVP